MTKILGDIAHKAARKMVSKKLAGMTKIMVEYHSGGIKPTPCDSCSTWDLPEACYYCSRR